MEHHHSEKALFSHIDGVRITGTHVSYFFICARKLWLFHHHIQCEHDSDPVRFGRHVHETSYAGPGFDGTKEKSIDGTIVIDRIDHKRRIVHETKTSKAMEKSHEWQLKFYLWYLEKKGIPVCEVADDLSGAALMELVDAPEREGFVGMLDYPLLKQRRVVGLSAADRTYLTDKLPENIRRIVSRTEPPPTVEWQVCRRCSYCEFCYS